MRKAQEDALARTEAERLVGGQLEDLNLIDNGEVEPTEAGRQLLSQVAKTVEFERGTSRDPDRNTVPMRRLVITTGWVVDPDALLNAEATQK